MPSRSKRGGLVPSLVVLAQSSPPLAICGVDSLFCALSLLSYRSNAVHKIHRRVQHPPLGFSAFPLKLFNVQPRFCEKFATFDRVLPSTSNGEVHTLRGLSPFWPEVSVQSAVVIPSNRTEVLGISQRHIRTSSRWSITRHDALRRIHQTIGT